MRTWAHVTALQFILWPSSHTLLLFASCKVPRLTAAAAPACTCAPFAHSYDDSNHTRYAPGLDNRSPAMLVQAGGRFFYATAARLLALKFILSMSVRQLRSSRSCCFPPSSATASPSTMRASPRPLSTHAYTRVYMRRLLLMC